jgi:CelD/BcsL family acetyltransferase involved in cellulose biosynthesis
MNTTLAAGRPADGFWEGYATLWRESLPPSVFQSPAVLQRHVAEHPDRVVVFTASVAERLVAASLFLRNGRTLSFLSDLKSDANHFVLHRDLSAAEQRACFAALLAEVARQDFALDLNMLAGWTAWKPHLDHALRGSGLYHLAMQQSTCPVATAESPEDLHARVAASRNTRYKLNKFLKRPGAGFETVEDGSGMAEWVEDFCTMHVLRWKDTPTPSAYRDPARRTFMRECLEAWQAEAALVRFALCVEGRRIGMVAGLRQGGVLFYHSPTFHPDFADLSPGRVLIHHITGWMAARGLHELDFGYGREDYKYQFATEERPLLRIFAAPRSHLAFMLRAKGISLVRRNRRVSELYLNTIKPLWRRWRSRTA